MTTMECAIAGCGTCRGKVQEAHRPGGRETRVHYPATCERSGGPTLREPSEANIDPHRLARSYAASLRPVDGGRGRRSRWWESVLALLAIGAVALALLTATGCDSHHCHYDGKGIDCHGRDPNEAAWRKPCGPR